jgi:hypothetical protein
LAQSIVLRWKDCLLCASYQLKKRCSLGFTRGYYPTRLAWPAFSKIERVCCRLGKWKVRDLYFQRKFGITLVYQHSSKYYHQRRQKNPWWQLETSFR